MSSSVLRAYAAVGVCLLCLPACVGYDAAAIDLATLAAAAPEPPRSPLTFRDAVAFALRHNPELARLAAEARAAGADVPATELEAQWDGADEMLALVVDPVALLRLGQRGAAVDVAAARGAAAVQTLAVARWRLVGQIAEVFAADTALAAVTAPEFTVAAEPFVRAGLASPSAAAMAAAAAQAALAERAMLESDRYALTSELRTLLGLRADAPLAITAVATTFPPLPADDEAPLQRPDLALALAQYQVADAEFRLAVTEQYPSLQLGPQLPLGGGGVDAMAVLRLPIGAGARAEAARERRTAARAQALAALQAATNDAHRTSREHTAHEQRAAATTAMADASRGALVAALAELTVDGEAFEKAANAAQMAVREAMERREAVVANARSRVRHAVAWGWPATEVQP